MTVIHEENGNKGRFYIEKDRNALAEMTYTRAGSSRIIIDHTEVNEALRGTGAGNEMLLKAVAYARENDLKILPLCPFAKSVFDKTPEIRDVL